MLEVFTPVPWSDFCDQNLERFTAEDLALGFVIRFRWIWRKLCVTSVFSQDAAESDLNERRALDLRIAGGDMGDLWGRIQDFAESEVQRRHAQHPFFERVTQEGRVHLARPFRSTAVCASRRGRLGEATDRDLTCRDCIRKANSQIRMKNLAYANILLSVEELTRARLPVVPSPQMDLLDQAADDMIERRRGGPI